MVDLLIDRFVEKVNSSPREPLWPEDVPPAVRQGPPDQAGYYDWQIRRSDAIDWIIPYEEKLPARLPPAFRSLVTRYIYPELHIDSLWLFANTGLDIMHEWCRAADVNDAKDYLTHLLITNGYIQFGRPYDAVNWDPICFDTNRRFNSGEYPIVQIDHESDKIRVRQRITPTFTEIIEEYVNGRSGLKL